MIIRAIVVWHSKLHVTTHRICSLAEVQHPISIFYLFLYLFRHSFLFNTLELLYKFLKQFSNFLNFQSQSSHQTGSNSRTYWAPAKNFLKATCVHFYSISGPPINFRYFKGTRVSSKTIPCTRVPKCPKAWGSTRWRVQFYPITSRSFREGETIPFLLQCRFRFLAELWTVPPLELMEFYWWNVEF